MVFVSTSEGLPLLPSAVQRGLLRRPYVVTSLALGSVVAIVSTVALLYSPSTSLEQTYSLPDGVEPVDQLSFTQAERVHENAAKKLDDVSSRENLKSYFNEIGEKYRRSAEEERQIRAVRHPGQIHRPSVVDTFVKQIKAISAHKKSKSERVKDDLADEAAHVQKAVGEGLIESHDSSTPMKFPSLNKALGEAVEQVKAAVQTKPADQSPAKTAHVTQLVGSKVKVEFYMESMCPGCKYFTTNVLSDLISKPGFLDMVDLKVYPYGNGKLTGTSIQCQHGSDECAGNKIIACMQSLYPVTSVSKGFMPAFTCLERSNGVPEVEAESCATSNGLDYAKVKQCANGPEGDQLALEAAQATESLSPPHEYAPWLTMNGEPLRDRAYDLKDEVCKAYSGEKTGTMCDLTSKKSPALQALALAARPSVCFPTSFSPAHAAHAVHRQAVAANLGKRQGSVAAPNHLAAHAAAPHHVGHPLADASAAKHAAARRAAASEHRRGWHGRGSATGGPK